MKTKITAAHIFNSFVPIAEFVTMGLIIAVVWMMISGIMDTKRKAAVVGRSQEYRAVRNQLRC